MSDIRLHKVSLGPDVRNGVFVWKQKIHKRYRVHEVCSGRKFK